ncbi:hypothetical protein JHK87_044413 [Glycine soja]|nr:hypothetical protein JHK87_044413 [Glycine soja]
MRGGWVGEFGGGVGVDWEVHILNVDKLDDNTRKSIRSVHNILDNYLCIQILIVVIPLLVKLKEIDLQMRGIQPCQRPSLMTMKQYLFSLLVGRVTSTDTGKNGESVQFDFVMLNIDFNVVEFNKLSSVEEALGPPNEKVSVFQFSRGYGTVPHKSHFRTVTLKDKFVTDSNDALLRTVIVKEKYREDRKDDDGEDWEKECLKLEKFTIRVCYQVMRCWLVSRDNLSKNVLKFLVDMDNVGIPLPRADLERLAWACTREDHYIVVKELYNRIRERYDKISLSVCNHAIWLMGKAKKWWAALEIYEDLLDKGPKPNNLSYELIVSHFNFLLSAAKRKGIWRWGVKLLNKMEDKGLKPGCREWNAVLVACSKASETTAAVQIFKRMVENGEKPTIISYGALLSALEKGKLYDDALRVWNHMIKVGVEPNAYAYTIMASIHTAQGNFNRVDAIIQEMVTLGIEVTVVTYNAIITGCAHNGMSSVAYEWFHRMKVQNISPNEITYEMLIVALANDGKPRLAYQLYTRAKNEGLTLSSKAYDAVVQSSQANNATIELGLLGPRPVDKKKKVQIRKTLNEFYNLAGVPKRSQPFDRNEIYHSQTEESP